MLKNSDLQKAMTKSEAKEELKIARNLQRKSDENKESPSKKYKEVRWAIDEIEVYFCRPLLLKFGLFF